MCFFRGLVVATIRRHHVARASASPIARDAEPHRANTLDAKRPRRKTISLIRNLSFPSKKYINLRLHDLLECLRHRGAHMPDDFEHGEPG